MLSRTLNLPLQLLFLIHLGQIASSTLTIYAACFYIGFYVFFRHQTAPSAEYFIIFTCFLSVIEAYFTVAYTIFTLCTAEAPRINYRLFLVTSSIMTILSWRAYRWVRTIPYLTEFDEGNNNGIYYYSDSVEHGTCAINDMIIIAGFLQVLFMALIPLWAIWGMWYEKRQKQGEIRLGDDSVDDGGPDGVLPVSEKKVVG